MVGAALAGGDCIEHVDVLRAGAVTELFDQVRAPSTVGTWLRSFTWASIRMLDAVLRVVLARAWAAGLGPERLDAPLTLDVDSSLCETYGLAEQGAARFSYQRNRGYHPLIAALAETGELAHARLRGGNANSVPLFRLRPCKNRYRTAPASTALEGHITRPGHRLFRPLSVPAVPCAA